MNSESDDEEVLPSLERPYLCCPPHMTIQYLCKHLVTRLSLARGGELELLVERISGKVSDQVLPAKVSSLRLNNMARGKTWAARPTGGKIVEVLESKATLQHVLKTCWDKSGNLNFAGLAVSFEDMMTRCTSQRWRFIIAEADESRIGLHKLRVKIIGRRKMGRQRQAKFLIPL